MPQKFIAGVDLGATNVRVVIANEDGDIEARRVGAYPGGGPERVLRDIGRTIDDLVRGVWVGAKVAGIGMALPGTVDPERGTVASIANLPDWGDVDIATELGRPRNVSVAVENDANAAAAGEAWLGAAKGMRDFVFIALGTGIGAGVWLDGKLHRGAHFLAGEAAFFPMTREQLRAPGWQHCLEGVVGGRAVASRARELLGESGTAAQLFEAAKAGEVAAATAWLRETQEYIAMAVADMIALLDPEAIVFGGGVAAAQGEWFIEPIREMVHGCTPLKTKIALSALGDDAQVIGAVKLALDRIREHA